MSIQDIILSDTFVGKDDYYKINEDDIARHSRDVWSSAEKILEGWGLPLPPFMTFPEPPTLHTIKWDPESELFYTPGYAMTNSSLSKLHDEIRATGADLLFDVKSVGQAPGVRAGVLLSDNLRVLVGWLDPRPYAANAYWDFLTSAREYLRDPKDFRLAYRFIDKHPMFWYQTKDGNWVDEYGFSTLSVDVITTKKGVRVALEGGASVPEFPGQHYHDYRLDATRKTFEKAVVAFAKNAHKHFDLDGTDFGKGLE